MNVNVAVSPGRMLVSSHSTLTMSNTGAYAVALNDDDHVSVPSEHSTTKSIFSPLGMLGAT